MSYFSFEQKRRANKCAVIGCAGVGAAASQVLSQSDLIDALVLIDPDKRRAQGLASDLGCALPLDSRTDIWVGDYTDLADCALIVLALGHARLHETAHADLIALNLPMIRKAAADMTANYSDAIFLVLSEPCEIMTHAFLQYSGLPKHKVIGIGTLPQTLHLRRLLGKYLGVNAHQIHACILGQSDSHGTLCLESAHVGGMALDQYLAAIGRSYDKAVLESLFDDTVHAFTRAEDANGCAAYAIAHACALVAACVLTDANAMLPLCIATDGYADLAQACMSLPCRIGQQGARVLPEVMLSPTELDGLRRAAARLHAQMLDAEQIFAQK